MRGATQQRAFFMKKLHEKIIEGKSSELNSYESTKTILKIISFIGLLLIMFINNWVAFIGFFLFCQCSWYLLELKMNKMNSISNEIMESHHKVLEELMSEVESLKNKKS